MFALDNYVNADTVENVHEKMQAWSFNELDNGAGIFKFAVIRDPIERFIAAYCHRVLDLAELSERAARKLSPDARLKRRHLKTDPDVHCFIDRLDDYRFSVYAIQHHTDKQTKFIGNNPKYFDKLFLFKELDKIASVIRNVVGCEISLPHKMKTKSRIDKNELRGSELKKLHDFYREDYELIDFLNDEG